MYNLVYNDIINEAPWEISLQKRLKYLIDNYNKRTKIVILIYDRPDNSTFRYRGYNIYKQLKTSEKWKAIYFFRNELEYLYEHINKISFVCMIRTQWAADLEDFIIYLKVNKVKIAFDVDDLVFDTNYIRLVTNTLNVSLNTESDCNFWFSYFSRIEYAAKYADAYISTNKYIGIKLKEKFKKPYFVIPNFLNEEQLVISKEMVKQKEKIKSDKTFTIGYFSGTPSHINDFKLVSSQLEKLLLEYENIRLLVVGYMEFDEAMKKLVKNGKVIFHPFVSFVKLQKLIGEVDVNIAPLVVNTFTNCKSELKYFEAAVVKTLSVVSPTAVYRNVIKHEHNGLICKECDWHSTLLKIYKGDYDINTITNNAYEHSVINYQGNNIKKQIEDVYDRISDTVKY